MSRITEAVRSLGLHDEEVTNRDEEGRTQDVILFTKAIGGFLDVSDTDALGVDVHFRYLTDRAHDVRERLRESVTAAGVSFYPSWSMTPDS